MKTKKQLAKSLLKCLNDISALLEHAHSVAINQQNGLTNNDPETITKACKLQEDILRQIKDSDQLVSIITADLAKTACIDCSGNSESIADAAGFPYTNLIKRQTLKITKLAAKVQEANEVNAILLKNGLEIVASCLKTLATDTNPTAYSNSAVITYIHPQQ